MARGCGVVLLIFAILVCVVGGIGTVIAITEINRDGGQQLAVFIIVDVFGFGLLVSSLIFLHYATKAAKIAESVQKLISVPTGDPTGSYPAGVLVTYHLDTTPYTVEYTPPGKGKNSRPSVLTISTPMDCPYEFHMVVETWFDRFCRRLGIAVEVETGDPQFDEHCFIRSDNPAFVEAYLQDPLKRIAILDLRRWGFNDLMLDRGQLTAKWIGFNPAVDHRPELRDEVAARLLVLSRNLPAPQPEFDVRVGAHRVRWQAVLWLALVGLALTVFSLIPYTPIHFGELLVRALLLGVIAWPVFAYLSAWLLSGTSRSHLAWAGLMIGSLFLFPLGCLGVVAVVNGWFDNSPATEHHAQIVEKYTTRSKNSTNYHVRVESWHTPGDTESFQISSSEYSQVTPHQSQLLVVTHEGCLGIEWFESKRVIAKP